MEDFSRCVTHTLDNIGYSAEIVKFRRFLWQETEKLFNQGPLHSNTWRKVIAGSKAEGITSLLESDIDVMYLYKNSICSDNVELLMQHPLILLQLDTLNAPPGYARLRLCTRPALDPVVNDSLITESVYHTPSGDMYASSLIFKLRIAQTLIRPDAFCCINGIQGPAFECSVFSLANHDAVGALYGINPDLLQSLRSRRRHSDWPPLDVLTDESSVVCQLVPVGMKGSSDQWFEWRFCFIETELKLTKSFNDTQLKMYIILKLVAKDILTVITTEITSYIMKNIVYWISEIHGRNVFREENLVELVLLGLNFLMVCIKGNNFPYYMIPARNLLAERLERQTRRQLSGLLSQIVKEGPRLFLRINKLRTGLTVLYVSPTTLVEYRNTRDKRERQLLIANVCGLYYMDGVGLYKDFPVFGAKFLSNVFPELRTMGLSDNYLSCICEQFCKCIKSESNVLSYLDDLLNNPAHRNMVLFVKARLKKYFT